MIKVFCKYSGAIISTTNQFANFPKSNRGNKLVAATHPIFELGVVKAINLATEKPIFKLSNTERHLLFVYFAKYTNTLDIQFPITDASISPRKVEELLPELVALCTDIKNNPVLWEEAKAGLPVTVINKDNHNRIDLESWFTVLLAPAVKELSYSVIGANGLRLANPSNIGLREEKTPDELELEVALKADLNNWTSSNRRNKYSADLADWAFTQWCKATGTSAQTQTGKEKRVAIRYLLNVPVEKLKTSEELEVLKKELVGILPREDKVHSSARTNTILVLRHIDSRLDYFESVIAMFTGGVEEVQSAIPDELGISWTTKKATTKPQPKLEAEKVLRTEAQNAEAAKTNPVLAKILARRAARLAEEG